MVKKIYLLILLLSFPAHASHDIGFLLDWVFYNPGFNLTTDSVISSDQHSSNIAMKLDQSSWGASLLYDIKFQGSFSGEVELNYRRLPFEGILGAELNLNQYSILANLYYFNAPWNIFSTYVGAGLGVGFFRGSGKYVFTGNPLTTGDYDGISSQKMLGQFRLGVSSMVSSVLSVFGGYQLLLSPTINAVNLSRVSCIYYLQDGNSAQCPVDVLPDEMGIRGLKVINSSIEIGMRYVL